MFSPKEEYEMERLNFLYQMKQFDPAKYLPHKEKPYIMNPHLGGDIFIIQETEEGWWREELEYKADQEAQIEKLKQDKTVACGWFGTNHIRGNGGWCDPNG